MGNFIDKKSNKVVDVFTVFFLEIDLIIFLENKKEENSTISKIVSSFTLADVMNFIHRKHWQVVTPVNYKYFKLHQVN